VIIQFSNFYKLCSSVLMNIYGVLELLYCRTPGEGAVSDDVMAQTEVCSLRYITSGMLLGSLLEYMLLIIFRYVLVKGANSELTEFSDGIK